MTASMAMFGVPPRVGVFPVEVERDRQEEASDLVSIFMTASMAMFGVPPRVGVYPVEVERDRQEEEGDAPKDLAH